MSDLGSELLKTARSLLDAAPSDELGQSAHLRRAVSTAYYAVFHTLDRACADRLIGVDQSKGPGPAWRQVYRALEHGQARKACDQAKRLGFSRNVVTFAEAFSSLQQERHRADYAPDIELTEFGVAELIATAETAMRSLQRCNEAEQTAFAALVLLKLRQQDGR